jgi:hypothetical protein
VKTPVPSRPRLHLQGDYVPARTVVTLDLRVRPDCEH